MIRKVPSIAAAAMAITPTTGWATVDTLDKGETSLTTLQTGFNITVKDATDVGNSVRVYVRPRNGNCVTGGIYKVTRTTPLPSFYEGTAEGDSLAHPTLHDNPMCDDSKYGYFSIDKDSEYTEQKMSYILWGTLKSYVVEVTFGEENWANNFTSDIIELRSDAH